MFLETQKFCFTFTKNTTMQGVKDYRIGNRLTYCGQPCYVLGLRKDIIELGYFIDSVGFERRYTNADIQPIPLTPELLESVGFKYGSTKGVVSFDEPTQEDEITHFWHLDVRQSDVVDRFTFSLVKWGEQEYFTFGFQLLRVRLKYLHQLQNLYYCLTETELPTTTLTHN